MSGLVCKSTEEELRSHTVGTFISHMPKMGECTESRKEGRLNPSRQASRTFVFLKRLADLFV